MKTDHQAGRILDAVVTAAADDVQKALPSESLKYTATATRRAGGRAALNLAGRTLWYLPGCFGIVRFLGPHYSLRCVTFHNVSDTESSLTKGLGVTITRANFEAALTFLARHYTPVSLQEVLQDPDGRKLPPRPVLVTFDDAYASVVEFAAPLCQKFGVPAVFFINAGCLDNQQLALDNLVCHVANALRMDAINAAARVVDSAKRTDLRSLQQVFSHFLPAVSLPARERLRDALSQLAHIRAEALAAEAGLYLTSQQLRSLATFNFEIGNHTYTHVNCRSLLRKDFDGEINRNKAVLEEISGRTVRSFSVPYGSWADLDSALEDHLRRTGHEAVFLSESLANPPSGDRFRLDRVSVKARSDAELFSELEVLPRLRTVRNRLSGVTNPGPHRKVSSLERVN
jgi:peptidoglycan/xylan/chitin deacetylase (PgdA/CDA1 family)